jgi:hypothetical protein
MDVPDDSAQSPPSAGKIRVPPAIVLLALVGYTLCVSALQTVRGARTDQFGAYPDEPAHYMAGLMVCDYIAAGFPSRPVTFAANYYSHMPFMAIGYWPPMFYAVEGLWMEVFGWQRTSLLLLVAVIVASVAATCFWVMAPYLGLPGAFLTGLLLLVTPVFQWSSSLVMTDILLTLVCLWFGLSFAAWAERPSPLGALLSGVLLAAAMLTKINSAQLVFTIGLFLAVANQWSLLRKPSFWIIPGISALLWLPWILSTHQLVLLGFGGLTRTNFEKLLYGLGRMLWINLSWLGILVLAGAIYGLRNRRANFTLVICALLPVSYAAFLLAAGLEIELRFLAPIIAPCIVLAGIGISRLARMSAFHKLRPQLVVPLIAAFSVTGFAATTGFGWHRPTRDTVTPVVEFLEGYGSPNASVLVPTSAEGPFIAEFARHDARRPQRILVRPTKLLASETWNGDAYRAKYSEETEMIAALDRFPVSFIIISQGKTMGTASHDRLLQTVIEGHPDRWTRVDAHSDRWAVYERTDGRKLTDREMEVLARDVLGERLRDIGK